MGAWETRRRPGYELPRAFAEAELEFTAKGGGQGELVRVIDRVDSGSVAGLRKGGSVQVVYPLASPADARIDGGQRTYARAALIHILGFTYGGFVVLILLAWPARWVVRRFRASPMASLMAAQAARRAPKPE
ncbi:MAG TPA: hypothetical protein VFS33_10810 [Gemmatimonadales bacterium]|nr:hypothetical protein [Gemmatimonadales bacterium]